MPIIIDLGAIAGLTSVALVSLLGQSRIFYSMAYDGLLPPIFAKVHPRTRTPWVSTIIIGEDFFLSNRIFHCIGLFRYSLRNVCCCLSTWHPW